MARSERITLRLSPEEKQRFEEEAREADMKLNPYLRKKLGLSNLSKPDRPRHDLQGERDELDRANYSSVISDEKAPEIRTDSQETAEASLGPLTKQLQNQGYTKPVAERMAQEKLGLK